jgi:hypothetical protein
MSYILIILGFDERNRLAPGATDPAAPGATHTLIGGCRPCAMTLSLDVCAVDVAPWDADAVGFASGPNTRPTDTKEIYVLAFSDRAAGFAWMTAHKDSLVGKQIHSIDPTLA